MQSHHAHGHYLMNNYYCHALVFCCVDGQLMEEKDHNIVDLLHCIFDTIILKPTAGFDPMAHIFTHLHAH